jgi:hypothetical protein
VVQFVTWEDEFGLLESTLSPPVYARLGDPVRHPGPYLVEGRMGAGLLQVQAVKPLYLR